jgi:hypothetical protein
VAHDGRRLDPRLRAGDRRAAIAARGLAPERRELLGRCTDGEVVVAVIVEVPDGEADAHASPAPPSSPKSSWKIALSSLAVIPDAEP